MSCFKKSSCWKGKDLSLFSDWIGTLLGLGLTSALNSASTTSTSTPSVTVNVNATATSSGSNNGMKFGKWYFFVKKKHKRTYLFLSSFALSSTIVSPTTLIYLLAHLRYFFDSWSITTFKKGTVIGLSTANAIMTSDLTSSELNSSPSVTVDVDASAEVSGSNYTGIFFFNFKALWNIQLSHSVCSS